MIEETGYQHFWRKRIHATDFFYKKDELPQLKEEIERRKI